MTIEYIISRINQAIEDEEQTQIKEMIYNGKIIINSNERYFNGRFASLGKTIRFDYGRINLVKSIEIDNIVRELNDLLMREEIPQWKYDHLLTKF